MWLLNTSSLELDEFFGSDIPPYAILSHTWGLEEISFKELPKIVKRQREKPGSCNIKAFSKITRCCQLAAAENLNYAWIDTCCINKESSAELSEAINSMYAWYEGARVCFAFLGDISVHEPRKFRKSRWFTRGWTLQELLAPKTVVFYDKHWIDLGTRSSLQSEICLATGINPDHIENHTTASVAAKMSWASARETMRTEDVAYCLLGLFGVNMPLLYGEGWKAFERLQHRIIEVNPDESIFAWHNEFQSWIKRTGMFAFEPRCFKESGDIIPIELPRLRRIPNSMTNFGLSMELCTVQIDPPFGRLHFDDDAHTRDEKFYEAPLACARTSAPNKPIKLLISERHTYAFRLSRDFTLSFPDLDSLAVRLDPPRRFFIRDESRYIPLPEISSCNFMFPSLSLRLTEAAGHRLSFVDTASVDVTTILEDGRIVSLSKSLDFHGQQYDLRFRHNDSKQEVLLVLFLKPNDPDKPKLPDFLRGYQLALSILSFDDMSRDDASATILKSMQMGFDSRFNAKLAENEFISIATRRTDIDIELHSYATRNQFVIDIDITSFDRTKILQ